MPFVKYTMLESVEGTDEITFIEKTIERVRLSLASDNEEDNIFEEKIEEDEKIEQTNHRNKRENKRNILLMTSSIL